MPMLAFGEYRPDVSDYNGQHTRLLNNVYPRGDGYGPVPDLQVYTAALPAACRGYFYARKSDGSVQVFAGTATRLYQLDNTDFTWTEVSKGGNAYSGCVNAANWQFAQFNNLVLATQSSDPVQVFDLSTDTEFDDLAGSPPQAGSIAIVGRFIVLSDLLGNPNRVQWSGLNATTTWTSGVNQSDFQDLPDGGHVKGVAGGESGFIFQDSAIRQMVYAPGSPVIFQIQRISEDDGIYAPYSLTKAGDRIFWLSPQGFKMLVPGGYPTPIGKEKVDRTLFADIDNGNLQLLIGAHDPSSTRVVFAYKSISGTTGLFDRALAYDWILDRWSPQSLMGEYLATLSKPGVTLESLDDISGNIDTMDFSLDNFSTSTPAKLSAFATDHKLGFFSGANLEAILETAEQGGDNRRIFIRNARPVTDAPSVFVSVSGREEIEAGTAYDTETEINAQGLCPQRISTRYARGRMRIPAGQAWNFASGIEPEVALEGQR